MYELNQSKYSIDFSRTKIIWFLEIPIIVPFYFNYDQEKYLKAALATLQLQNKSVDNVLKKHFGSEYDENFVNAKSSEISFQEKLNGIIENYFDFHNEIFFDYETKLGNINFQNADDSLFHCGIIFKKLKSNFKALKMLIKFDFYYESFTIIRQIVEQLAFAYDSSFRENVDEFMSPSHSITKLKEFYPKIGKFYGILSSKSHIDKTQFKNHYQVDLENSENTGVILHSIENTIEVCVNSLIALDLYCCVFEYIFFEYVDEKKNISEEKVLLNKTKTRLFVNQFQQNALELFNDYYRNKNNI